MSKRFQKTRIVDKWGGIYDSKTDKVLNVNDVEHKLNEQQDIIEAKDSLLSILSKENEQLRQQQQRLYNYFRDYLEDEMSAENFSEMWDNVKEDERWNDE